MSAFPAFRSRPSLRLLLLLLVPLPLLAAPAKAPARDPVRDQTPSFEGVSQVVAVEVPVNVVDRDGSPVRGLTAADFEVFDDGEPQKVSSFEVVDLKTLDDQAAPRPGKTPSTGRRPCAPVRGATSCSCSTSPSPTRRRSLRPGSRRATSSSPRSTPRISRRWRPTRSRPAPSWW